MKYDNAEKEYEAEQIAELLDEMELEEQMTLAKAEAFDAVLAVMRHILEQDPNGALNLSSVIAVMEQALEQQKKVFM